LAQVLVEDGIGPFVAWWEANPILKPAKPLARPVEEALRCLRLNQEPHALAAVMKTLSQGRMDVLMDRLPQLDIPVLLVTGEADRIYSERLRAMATRLPRATLRIIPDAGHAVHRERPEALHAAVIEFLRAA
jgi:pimeloyl-ACP methyl ester carboxylesterase